MARRLELAGAPVGRGFEIALSAISRGRGGVDPEHYRLAGVTVWLESISPSFGDEGKMFARVGMGPPG